MEAIVGGRQVGKTYRLIQWMKDNPEAITIVADQGQRRFYMLELLRHGVCETEQQAEERVLAVDQVVRDHKLYGKQSRDKRLSLAVDNLDHVLARLFTVEPELVTFTGAVQQLLTPPDWTPWAKDWKDA